MSIRKRVSARTGITTYQARYYYKDPHGRTHRDTRTFKRKADAERFLKAKNAELHPVTPTSTRAPARSRSRRWRRSGRRAITGST